MTKVCKISEDNFPDSEDEYIVLGQWVVKKEFTVASLALYSEIAKANQQGGEMLKVHTEICSELENKGKLIEDVARFFSLESLKK